MPPLVALALTRGVAEVFGLRITGALAAPMAAAWMEICPVPAEVSKSTAAPPVLDSVPLTTSVMALPAMEFAPDSRVCIAPLLVKLRLSLVASGAWKLQPPLPVCTTLTVCAEPAFDCMPLRFSGPSTTRWISPALPAPAVVACRPTRLLA